MSHKFYWKVNLTKGVKKGVLFMFLALLVASIPALAQMNVTATAVPTSGTAPLNVTFTADVCGGTIPYTFDWDFGDASTHGTTNPITHTYNLAGKYSVRLTVTDSSATPLSTTITVATITVYLAVTIEADPQCGPPPINACFNLTTTGGVEPYSYTWNFGDSAPAFNIHEKCPCHAYESCGLYNASVSVVDAAGNKGSANFSIYVFDFTVTPSADITLGVPNLRVNFDSSVSFCGPSFPIPYCDNNKFCWDFGDDSGNCSCCDKSPQHIYSAEGTYTVTLTVKIECGGNEFTKTGTMDINVVPDPTIYITQPSNNGVWTGPVGTLQSQVYSKSDVLRVDYYINDNFVGSTSVAPYKVTLDICGASGVYAVKAIVYTKDGKSASSESVNVVINNPTLDGTNYVLKDPFRIKFFGTGFKPGAKLYFNGIESPITKVLSSNIIVAKGGQALKALVPQGVPVIVTIVNKDGSCSAPITFQRQ